MKVFNRIASLLFQENEPVPVTNFEEKKNDDVKRLQRMMVCILIKSPPTMWWRLIVLVLSIVVIIIVIILQQFNDVSQYSSKHHKIFFEHTLMDYPET